jgi:thioredoxin reductase
MILVAVGAQPETEIALASGFKGALQVNRRMETNVRDIFAAGDCAETWHRITQSNAYLPLANHRTQAGARCRRERGRG